MVSRQAVIINNRQTLTTRCLLLAERRDTEEMVLSLAQKDREIMEKTVQRGKEIMVETSAELDALKNTILFGQSEEYKP